MVILFYNYRDQRFYEIMMNYSYFQLREEKTRNMNLYEKTVVKVDATILVYY